MKNKDQILLQKIYTEGLYSDDIDDETEEDEMEPLYIKGEYWFDETGEPMYADGDYGDMNHEMYVMDRCAGEVLSWFDIERYGDEMPLNLDNHIDEIVQFIFQKLNITDEEKKENIENDPHDAIINYLKNHTTMKGPIQEIVYLAGDSLSSDGREFAIKEWGWSRVHQNHIEVKKLTREQLKIVASGINSALDQEGVYGDDDWLRASQSEYNISTYTGKRYKIKLEDMEKGNVQGLERADIEQSVTAATQQVRQMDVSQTPSFYKGHLGDSFVLNKDQMILENIYNIILENAGLYGWMDPNGKFIPLKYGENHYDGAYDILIKIYKMSPKDAYEALHPQTSYQYDYLFEKNWLRITYQGSLVYCHNPRGYPTPKQKNELINIGIEKNIKTIFFDDEEDSHIIWSSDDIL